MIKKWDIIQVIFKGLQSFKNFNFIRNIHLDLPYIISHSESKTKIADQIGYKTQAHHIYRREEYVLHFQIDRWIIIKKHVIGL